MTVLINLGQCAFEYAPTNDQRMADPCFKRPLFPSPQKVPDVLYEDYGDLFSMGKLDSQWLANIDSSNTHGVQLKCPPSEIQSSLRFPSLFHILSQIMVRLGILPRQCLLKLGTELGYLILKQSR